MIPPRPGLDRRRVRTGPDLRAATLLIILIALAGCAPGTTSTASPSGGPTTSAPTVPSAGPSVPTAASPSPSITPAPSSTAVIYLVRTGDTLTAIARRFGTTARSIAFWNRVTYPTLDPQSSAYDPNRIEVGWNLVIHPGETVDENDLPPGPSPTPRPSLTLPPVPSPSPGATSAVVTAGPRGGNGVALTFDMGGRLDPALDIVGWLVDHHVAASVFPTGKTASTTTIGQQVMATIAAHPDLFTIGNHTWDHPDLTTIDASAVAKELQDTETAVLDLTGRSTKPFFRPPYGTQDLATRQTAGSLGWAYTVLWDVDTVDWKPISDGGPTADDIVARVLSRAKGGSIVLMHLGGYETFAALPRIVDGLRARGLEPVTLDLLFGR